MKPYSRGKTCDGGFVQKKVERKCFVNWVIPKYALQVKEYATYCQSRYC